ncbi:hypothetical protein [Terrihabitans sp. B22-R8]|uniref:hypothetical protein n=1 Tax=Terrihabitans sp. B22-R8 TaxID=3425128 RepID=UPI00403C1CB2
MNGKVILLIIGLVAGGLIGYVTRPQSAEISLPGVNIQITGDEPARGGGDITSDQWQHIGLFAVIGGIIGLGLGFVADRRRL